MAAIKKQDLLKLLDEIDSSDVEAVYWAVKGIIDHHDQSWYWSEQWQREEREVDEWKANGQRTGPMEAEEALKLLDDIIEQGGQQSK
jgi:hypothetical protein